MSQSILLETSEKDILGSLDVGLAVVKLQGRAPRPFLIAIPEFEIKKGLITDRALEIKMGASSHVDSRHKPVVDSMSSHASPPVDHDGPALIADPRIPTFLADVRDYPDSGIAARYKRLGISVRQGQKLKAGLLDRQFIEDCEIRTNTGRIRVVRLTEKGSGFLEQTCLGQKQSQDDEIS